MHVTVSVSTSTPERIFLTSSNLSMDNRNRKSSIHNSLCSNPHSTLNPSKLRPLSPGNKAGDNQEASISLVNNNPNKPKSSWNPHSFR